MPGRGFDCSTCKIQHIRRCREDREDFTSDDSPQFPIYIHPGGELYSFCPAKATWSQKVVEMFNLLVTIAETGVMPYSGGLYEQPEELVELIPWFVPKYSAYKMAQMFGGIGGSHGNK